MAYTTYSFYSTEYHGDTISSSPFEKWSDRASDKLDTLTFGRLRGHIEIDNSLVTSDFDEDTTKKIQKAVCAVADVLYAIDEAVKSNVKSKSSGNESITYTETAIDKAAVDSAVKKRLIYEAASEYLTGTVDLNGIGLLFAGV